MTKSANIARYDLQGEPPEEIWGKLVPRVVHPAKVAAIEAMLWMEQPLSSNQLVNLLEDDEFYLSLVSYHVRQLAKFGVLRRVKSRRRRGATETYYYFPEEAKQS